MSSTLAEMVAGEDGRKTYQHRAGSLFDATDKDQSGTIDRSEFEELYNQARKEALEELEREHALEKKVTSTKRRVKAIGLLSAILFGLLAASITTTCVAMYLIADSMKDSDVIDGSMLDRKSGSVVGTNTNGNESEMLELPKMGNMDAYNGLGMINYHQNGVTYGATVKSWQWYSANLMVLSLDNGADMSIDRAANTTNVVEKVGKVFWEANVPVVSGYVDASSAAVAAAGCADVGIKCPLNSCEVNFATSTSFHSITCKGLELWNWRSDLLLSAKSVPPSRRKMTALHVANAVVSFGAGYVGLSYPGMNRIAGTLGGLTAFAVENRNSCHPKGTLVFDANGKERRIDSIAIGDKIMGPNGPTTVIGFLHRDAYSKFGYLRLTTSKGAVTLSKEHMLIVNGELKAAGAATVGDVLNADGKPASIEHIEEIIDTGAFHIFVDSPTYLARDEHGQSKLEVSNLMHWDQDGWDLQEFIAMYERAKVCYAKGKPFDFTPEWWYGRNHKGVSKYDAIHCDGETASPSSAALPAPSVMP